MHCALSAATEGSTAKLRDIPFWLHSLSMEEREGSVNAKKAGENEIYEHFEHPKALADFRNDVEGRLGN